MTVNSDSLTFCPRLIDYLAFVSCEGHPILEGICNQTPKLLKCYPPNKHHDFILPNDVVYFCQPEGCISSSLASTRLGTTTFVFTLTDKDADKTRFGICLNFYRPCSVTYSVSLNNESKGNQVSDPLHFRTKEEHLNDNNKQSILTSLCLISHHPFFSKFRQCLHSLKEIIDRCDEYCRNLYGADNTFYSFWSTLLTGGSIKKASFNRLESQIVYEIESWIIHLLNAPVPLPGKTCLHLSVGPEAFYEKLVFALPDKTRLTLIDFPLHLPLELLGMETCLKVLTAIMLEQKVVLQSRDYNALTMSVMAFTAMLYPLQYMFPAIPLLPNSLEGGENLLLSPTPYIIGIPATFLSQKADFRFPADVWLVDLDTNKMMGSSLLEPIPTLPEKEGQELCQNLHQALVSMTADSGSDGEPTEMESKALSKSLNSVDSADVATRVAMVRFFNSLNVLGNIAEHTRTVRLFPRPVVAFQRFSFLKSRQILTPFTRKLAETQAVEFFAEWCLYPENEVFQRIHAGIHDPEQIGDKVIWYENTLAQINFEIWSTEETNRYTALNFIHSVSIDNGHINNFEMIHHHFPKSTNTTYDLNALYNPPETLEDLLRNAVQLQQPMRKNQPKRRPNQQSEQVDSFDSSSAKMQMMRSTKSDDVNQAILYEKKNLPGPMYTIPSMAESSSDSSDDQDDSDIWDLKNSVDQLDMKKDTNKMNPMETVARIDNLTNELTGENFKQNIGSENLIVNSSVNVATLRKPSLHRLSTPQQYANHLQLNDDDEEKKRIVHYNEEQSEVVLDKDERKEDEEVVDVNDDEDDMEQTSVGKYLLNNLSDNIADAASHASTAISGLINKQKTIVRKSGNLMKKMATEIQTSAKHDLKINDSIVTTDPSNNVYKSKEFSGHKQDVDLIQSASKFVLNLPKKQIFHFGANQTRQQEEQLSNRSRTISVKESSSNLVNVEKSYADQEFLRELVQCIHEKKTGITTKFSVNRLRDLLNDENYRNYLMLKLNRELSKSFEDPDECIPDVAIINMDAYKTYIWLLQSMIRGLEQTCTNHGIGGLASAMMLLELCHTHYLDMRSNTVSPIKSQGSQNSTVDQSRDDENLVTAFTGWLRTTTKDLKKVAKPNIVTDGNWTNRVSGLFGLPNTRGTLDSHQNSTPNLTRKEIQPQQSSVVNTSLQTTNDLSNPVSKAVVRRKSQHASAYRFVHGNLIDLNNRNQSNTVGDDDNNFESDKSTNYKKVNAINESPDRIYVFENLIGENERSRLWDHMQFWEDTFFDTVAQERDILGMDQAPMEMIEQFLHMNATQKRLLMLKEDRLLAICLHNLIAFMILMRVDKSVLVNHVRRLLARCRIGSYFASAVSNLLDNIKYLEGNSVDLLPSLTRLKIFQSYEIEMLNPPRKETRILEIYGKCLIFRNLLGEVIKKLNYDQLTDLLFKDSIVSIRFSGEESCDRFSSFQFRCDKAKQICHTIESLIQKKDVENFQH